MKRFFSFLVILLIVSGARGKENTYTGSTPAGTSVRTFLGIPFSDSVDFIRWKLRLEDNRYELQCNYGISKANTNGFISGGANVELKGNCKKERNYYQLQNGTKDLKVAVLNEDLLHLLGADKSLLVGNAGWSYTLNNITTSNTNQVTITSAPTVLKDSMSFEGRTPCQVPGVISTGSECYKLKWHVVLYANTNANEPSRYKVFGTPWRKEGGRTGTWKIVSRQNGSTIYQLNDEKGNGYLYLLKLDEHILMFTDAQGKLIVGNEDFSYTLNRKW